MAQHKESDRIARGGRPARHAREVRRLLLGITYPTLKKKIDDFGI